MANQALRRVDPHSNLVDAINLLVDVLKGRSGDTLILRYDGASYALDVDNPSGNHLNAGGVFLVTDAAIAVVTELDIHAAKKLLFFNAADTNTANLYHSGTNDVLKSDDGLWLALGLGVGVTPPAAGINSAGHLIFATDNTYDIGANGATRPRTVYVGTSTGIGIAPTATLHVSRSDAGNWVTILDQVASSAGSGALQVKLAATTATDPILQIQSGGTVRYAFYGDGSFTGKGGEAVQKQTQAAAASAALTLGFAFASFSPACSVTLTPGNWTVWAIWHFESIGDSGMHARGQLHTVSGSATITSSTAFSQAPFTVAGYVYEATGEWQVTVTATAVIEIQAMKTGGAGTSTALADTSRMVAKYHGNPV